MMIKFNDMLLTLLFIYFGLGFSIPSMAQKLPTRSCELRIVDSKEAPIEGALFSLHSFNGNYFVPVGPMAEFAKQRQSNSRGIIEVHYPNLPLFGTPLEYAGGSIHHPDFLSQDIQFQLALDAKKERTIEMKHGVDVRIDLNSDIDDQPLKPCGVVFSKSGPPLIRRVRNDRLETQAIAYGTWQAMFVQPDANGATLFSSATTFQLQEKQSSLALNGLLETGIAIRGKLDASVPRPIRNGRVLLYMLVGTAMEGIDPVEWHDYVPIHENGTFEFPSVPKGGRLQLIAFCEGWISKEIVRDHFVEGKILEIKNADINVELSMNRTYKARFHMEDDSKNPVKGVNLSCFANQQYLTGSNTMLGVMIKSIRSIDAQIEGRLAETGNVVWPSFGGASGEDGIVEVDGLPRVPKRLSVNITSPFAKSPWMESFDGPSGDELIIEHTIRIAP